MAKSDEILRKTTEILSSNAAEREAARLQLERERRQLVGSIGKDVAEMLTPTLERIVQANQISAEQIRSIIREIKIEAPKMPEINIPPVNVPRPNVTVKAPTVNIPEVRIPETKINFPDRMSVTMDAVDRNTPLPVMMMDGKGKPMSFSAGASGGKADFFTIKNIIDSSGASLINDEGKLKVDASVSASISQDYGSGEIGSQTVRMVMATDAIASVNVVAGSTSGTEYNDGDTASVPAGTVLMGDTGEESGNIYAVALGSGVVGSSVMRVVHAADVGLSVNAIGGTIDTVTTVTGITNSVAANIVDSSGVAYSGSNPVPVSGQVTAVPINVRGSRATAYATISSDAATTLLAGVASTYLDLVYVMGANQSDGAVTLDFYTGSGGATMLSLEIPANSTAGVAPATAIPMTEAAQAWYVYYADSDVTGTTVDVTALFSKET